MIHWKFRSILLTLLMTTTLPVLLSGCRDDEVQTAKDYFPINNTLHWQYLYEVRCDCPEQYTVISDNIQQWVSGDTLVNGKTYSKIRNEYGLLRMVRREGNRYFDLNFSDQKEYVFLNAALPVKSSWVIYEAYSWKHEFIVEKSLPQMTVNGVLYHDVLVIDDRMVYMGASKPLIMSVYHYYANGTGEILTEYPRTQYTYENGTRISLLKFE